MRDETQTTGATLERAILTVHRELDRLFVRADEAFGAPEVSDALREAFSILQSELNVHFDQEESLYYATIGALRPDLVPKLAAFEEGHKRFRAALDAIASRLEARDREAARTGFEDLLTRFEDHERSEERVLASLDDG